MMPWSTLPPEVLAKILSNIRFRDRVEFSLVCRQWNDVIFGLCPSADYLLPLRSYSYSDLCIDHVPSLLRSSARRYRNLEVNWEESELRPDNREDTFFTHLDQALVILAEKGSIKCLWLTAPLDQRMVRFFAKHEALIDSLEELWVTISTKCFTYTVSNTKWTPVQVRLSNLRSLKWDEYENYTGEIFKDFIFGLSMPKVTKVKLRRGHDFESRDRSLIELRDAENVCELTVANLEEYCSRQYFKVARPKLRRLRLDNTLNKMANQELLEIASNLPNVQHLKISMVWIDFATSLSLASMLQSLTELTMDLHLVNLTHFSKKLQDIHGLTILHLNCHSRCTVEESIQIKLLKLVEFRCLYEINESDSRVFLFCPRIVVFEQTSDVSNGGNAIFFQLQSF